MGPRKKSKPNPKAEADSQGHFESQKLEVQKQQTSTPRISPDSSKPVERSDEAGISKSSNDGPSTTPPSSKNWYGGTWPRGHKATPVTQVAKESVSSANGAASELVASARSYTSQLPTTPFKSPAVYLPRSIASSSRSLPLAATTTKLNITTNSPNTTKSAAQEDQIVEPRNNIEEPNVLGDAKETSVKEKEEGSLSGDNGPHHHPVVEQKDEPPDDFKSNRDSAGWLHWFSKVDEPQNRNAGDRRSSARSEQITDNVEESLHKTKIDTSEDTNSSPKQRRNSDPSPVSPKVQQEPPPRSWLGLWGNATTQFQNSTSASATGIATAEPNMPDEAMTKAKKLNTARPSPQSVDNRKPYGWAFWSKDESRDDDGNKRPDNHAGQLAQAASLTQLKPENAAIDKHRGVPEKVKERQRPLSSASIEDSQNPRGAEESGKKNIRNDTVATKTKSVAVAGLKAKRMPENLLLPLMKQTFSCVGRPSFIQQLSRLLQLGQPSDTKHISIAQNPHRVKRALAIGVHGYFPAPLIRSVLGQPTGTSVRFANSAASAIQQWTQDQGYSCEVEKVALEGEGKIAERIDLLWKLMLNWIEKIRKADFVMIACHSQGVPVAMMLLAKLIAFGCVNSAKLGICAMAGVNLGPFADYKSRWISGSAGELFEFAQPESQVSKDYEAALDVALRFGVKIVYVGSIDDQLVSLDSSTFGPVSHPHIYRAVFVDGRVHAPDFLTHLVGFALKLRNLGISDHGLIRELSTPLAGSLYGGEGHSRIYEDEAVYYLAVEHALETTSLGNIPLQIHRENQTTSQNPYILPFAMRGLLEENFVRTELYGEITELIKQFDDWKPSSKVLKDVKFRLEGVRSRL